MIKFIIGLVNREYGCERILEQEKVPWEIVNFRDLNKYSLIILNSNNLSTLILDKVRNYLMNGGAVLTDALSLKKIDKNKIIKKIYIKNIRGSNNLFRNLNFINIEMFGYRIKEANVGKINEKYRAIYISKFGNGFVIALPFNLNDLMLDERSKKLYFSSPNVLLKEEVSLISKGNLRRLIVNCFHYLHLIRGIPYIHIWYYPNNYHTVFCYRLDLDIFNDKEINNIISIIKRNNISFSWFLSVINNKNYKKGIKYLYKINQDIQSHSYEHIIYNSFEKNYNNILKSNNFILKLLNKPPIGFAAPFGHWNKSLGESLEKLDYLYSSEFSLSYDDLPFYPFLYKDRSKVIQLPIYPICTGSLRLRLYNTSKMKDYFNYLINMQYKKQMPLFLYDHPNDGIGVYFEVFNFIIKKIKNFGDVGISNMTEFAKWWKKREKVSLNVQLINNKLKITTNNKNKNIYLRVILPSYEEVRMPLKNQIIDISKLNTKKIPFFKSKRISGVDILRSKILFSLFYMGVLFKAVKRRLFLK